MTSPPPSSTLSLSLIIRFTTSLPDLQLTIPNPRTTTTSTLYTLIRPHLPLSVSVSPLRLIYNGALLSPTASLTTALRLSSRGKSPAKIYIHCSISSDTQLSTAQLEAENEAAKALQTQSQPPEEQQVNNNGTAIDTTVQSAPQGFDRLLSAGLSPTEVASLRSQFLAVQAHTHTPDTMPTPAEMRLLEERWLDAGTPLNARGSEAVGADDDFGSGGLEDMLWGNVMGFFWAVGAIVWLVREEGVWSKRRQVGVVTGVLVNIAFCILRMGS